jgi:hypothetical protein
MGQESINLSTQESDSILMELLPLDKENKLGKHLLAKQNVSDFLPKRRSVSKHANERAFNVA